MLTPVPAQQRLGPATADTGWSAIYQSMNLINDDNPDLVVVGADHVYRMDADIVDQHLAHGAGVTEPVSRQDAKAGIVGVADNGRTITSFLEKPLPDSPDQAPLNACHRIKDALHPDAKDEASPGRTFGGNLIPMLVDPRPRAGL